MLPEFMGPAITLNMLEHWQFPIQILFWRSCFLHPRWRMQKWGDCWWQAPWPCCPAVWPSWRAARIWQYSIWKKNNFPHAKTCLMKLNFDKEKKKKRLSVDLVPQHPTFLIWDKRGKLSKLLKKQQQAEYKQQKPGKKKKSCWKFL